MLLWLVVIYMFAEALFFGTKSVFIGETNEGLSNYGYFVIFIVLFIMIFLYLKLINFSNLKDKSFQYSRVIIVSLVFILFTFMLVGVVQFKGDSFIMQQSQYFLSFVIPAVILGMMVTEEGIFKLFDRLKFINIYLSICFLFALLSDLGQDLSMFHELGGATHLTIGYAMSAMFSVNLLSFLYQRNILFKLFYLVLMLFNISVILFSGSRGALVSVLLMLVLSFMVYMIWKKKIFQGVVLSFSFIAVVPILFRSEDFSFAIERIFAIFNSSEDESSSQRIMLHDVALNNFYDNPIIGKGIGSFSNEIGFYNHPHNIFFEILNDFGLIGIGILIFILCFLLMKCFWIIKQKSHKGHILVFLLLNVLVQLMFSGSYLANNQFWLLVTIIFCFNRQKYKDAEADLIKSE